MSKDQAPIDRAHTAGPQAHSRRQMMRGACALAAVLPLGGCEFFEALQYAGGTRRPAYKETGGNGDGGGGGGPQGGGGGGYGGGY